MAAIPRIAGKPDDVTTLDAYCAAGSLRRAADLLYLHHSSVARRRAIRFPAASMQPVAPASGTHGCWHFRQPEPEVTNEVVVAQTVVGRSPGGSCHRRRRRRCGPGGAV